MKRLVGLCILFVAIGFSLANCGGIIKPDYVKSYEQGEKNYKKRRYKTSLAYYNKSIAQQMVSSSEVIDAYLKSAIVFARLGNKKEGYERLNDLRYLVRRISDKEERTKLYKKIYATRKKIRKVKARRRRRRTRKVDPKKIQKIYSQAVSAYRKKNMMKAYQLFRRIEDQDYKDTDSYISKLEVQINSKIEGLFKKGYQLYSEDKFKESISYFKQILKIDPNHKDANYYKNKAQRKLKVLESM